MPTAGPSGAARRGTGPPRASPPRLAFTSPLPEQSVCFPRHLHRGTAPKLWSQQRWLRQSFTGGHTRFEVPKAIAGGPCSLKCSQVLGVNSRTENAVRCVKNRTRARRGRGTSPRRRLALRWPQVGPGLVRCRAHLV